MAETAAQPCGAILVIFEHLLKLEKQVVIIQQGILAAKTAVGKSHFLKRPGMGQKMPGAVLQDLVNGQFLVAGLAQN